METHIILNNDNEQHKLYVLFFYYLKKRVLIMPKTKFHDFIFTIIMVTFMVYTMVCYNVAVNMGGLTNQTFVVALGELPIMVAIAFIFEFFLIGKLAQKLAFKFVNPKKDKPIFVTLAISTMTVCLMCPIMSFFGSVLFGFDGMSNIISRWLQISVLNFPMALCSQLFYIGPCVRFIFKKIFRNNI